MPSASDGGQERFDPGAIILEQQRKKDAQAAQQKHEAKNDQLDQFRKQVKLEDTNRAKDTWKEAEAALNQVLRSKDKATKQADVAASPNRDNGLRTHGQHVSHRKTRSLMTQQAPEGSSPLRRSSGDPAATFPGGGSDWQDLEAAGSSGSGSPGGTMRLSSRQDCFEKRSQLRREKSVRAGERKADHERRRLRLKIATVLIEVRKRQQLHQGQEKAKKFREQRFAAGRGPTASLGDTDEYALGLTCLSESANEQAMTSPRRTALLESLTMEELGVLRGEPSFFFTGNAIASAMTPDQMDRSRSLGALPSVSSSSFSSPGDTGKAPKGLCFGPVDSSIFEDLIEFFSVSSADKALDISVYAQNLRAQLLASAGRHNHPLGAGAGSSVDWRKRLCREPEESPEEEQTLVDDSVQSGPLEMMPCLGRHPPVRADQSSPTLMKVREVYQRRDDQDSAWIGEREESISRRVALNAFKAREQQRELQLQDFQQKELHKVRMLQAEEKKAMIDAEFQERIEVMGIQKIHRLMVANDRADRHREEKQIQASMSLETWHTGVDRAQSNVRKMEWEKRKIGERSQEKYIKRLIGLGESRQNVVRGQVQKNDELKGRIQGSLCMQLKEQELQDSLARGEAYKTKLENAALRRHIAQGHRYCFVEKAFGANAVGFDAKSHSIAVDRRSKSWQKSAEAWSKMKNSFSAQDLPSRRPLSPGGALDEAGFKALSQSCAGFRTATSAVALA